MAKPILIIQMQRMGDLILSFPLMLWLERTFPGHPIWVMAEPRFAAPLVRISPNVRYVGFDRHDLVTREKFALVVNLSHRPESLTLAGQLETEALIGGYVRNGIHRIAGTWQEYRTSLTHNNRHNCFHWADLNALDVIPLATMAATRWPAPRTMASSGRKVGLFLGASDPGKRPGVAFWAGLVGELERRKWVPILLGGPAEKALGREVRSAAGHGVANACGTLGLDQFAVLGQSLAAMITPDTGPMHLAAWSGLRVLNLSMGPVHAWETGPYQPGHVVLRSARDCVGCWQCRFETPRCHESFAPTRVVRVLEAMAHGQGLARLKPPGLEILATGRDALGLYDLAHLWSRPCAGQAVSAYWRAFWAHAFGLAGDEKCRRAAGELWSNHERLARGMARAGLEFVREVSSSMSDPGRFVGHWTASAPMLRPLTGYAAIHLANHDGASASVRQVLDLGELHLSLLSR
ncbi:MAG: glycosyltransferase family 9 protein [Deltaproteobacteria bacterium]|nr:glycosyltransferase family 9 protein [Deltaproteobacteria bacterium]